MKTKKIPVLFSNPSNCYGCTACFARCTAKAIVMRSSNEGFLYPMIDTEKCTGCNECLSVCPSKQKNNGS